MNAFGAPPDYVDGSHRGKVLKAARRTVWLVAGSLLLALVWAALAEISEITRGDARVIPLRRMQTIQSLEGGILSDLLVQEGDIVTEGQVLAKMDATRFRAAFLETQAEIETLEAEILRLEAEVSESETFPIAEGDLSETLANELKLFRARRTKLDESIGAAEAERRAIQTQIDITAPLTEEGSVSRVDLLRLQQQEAALQGRISDLRNSYVQEAYRDLVPKRRGSWCWNSS